MRRLGLWLGIGLLSGAPVLWGAETNAPAPDFKEVYTLVREHLAGATDTELNRTAVQAFVTALSPRVALVGSSGQPGVPAGTALVSRTNLFEGQIGYVRVSRVAEGLAPALQGACHQLQSGLTNRLQGLVLDLRYAGGADYGAAAGTADEFLTKERPLLDWGKDMVRSKEKTDALSLPVAVLVNHETAGASEALAAVLRQTGVALILGTNTAGQAMMAQDYSLANGQRLRIATGPITLGDGSALSFKGLKPDITVEVNPQAERTYFMDAFQILPQTNLLAGAGMSASNHLSGTNRAVRRPRFNEAELVRERKEGFNPELELSAGQAGEAEKPVVQDPVLARALDVLKGLAVVRAARS